jgi:hypothetical protein
VVIAEFERRDVATVLHLLAHVDVDGYPIALGQKTRATATITCARTRCGITKQKVC